MRASMRSRSRSPSSPPAISALGRPRLLGLAIDWTSFDTTLPAGRRIRYHVLRIAVPRRGRAVPLLHLAYDRDDLPSGKSQNQLEEEALAAVLAALPAGVRPVILADRGFARASFLEWLQQHALDYVVRIDKGTCITQTDGRRWKFGAEGLQRGDLRFHPAVRYGLSHGRPRDLPIHLALTWRLPRHQQRDRRQAKPERPWYLATNQPIAAQAVAWYRQRFWIEESFKDSKSRFRLKHVQIGTPARLTRLLLALTIAWCWLALAALPESGTLPAGWHAALACRAGMPHWHAALACRRGCLGTSQLPQSRPRPARRDARCTPPLADKHPMRRWAADARDRRPFLRPASGGDSW